MDTIEYNLQDWEKMPEKELLSLVAERLKDRELFPRLNEAARQYLSNIKALVAIEPI